MDRFLALVRRELQADDVRVLEETAVPPEAVNVLSARLLDGRHVVVTFSRAPEARDVLARRLDILVGTFAQSAEHANEEQKGSRPPPARSLFHELKALVSRANAFDAVVIDANSPMVWGSATERGPAPLEDSIRRIEAAELGSGPDIVPHSRRSSRPPPGEDEEEGDHIPEPTRKAIEAVRSLPGLAALTKGKHLNHIERGTAFYVVASFGIYVLVLVYDAPFDELRAQRAVQDALPTIERLVLALPPLDPEPPIAGANVMRMRRRR